MAKTAHFICRLVVFCNLIALVFLKINSDCRLRPTDLITEPDCAKLRSTGAPTTFIRDETYCDEIYWHCDGDKAVVRTCHNDDLPIVNSNYCEC